MIGRNNSSAVLTRTIDGGFNGEEKISFLLSKFALWDCPNLIITPHISGPSLPEDMVEIFKENFRRFLVKEPLVGLIDFSRGF